MSGVGRQVVGPLADRRPPSARAAPGARRPRRDGVLGRDQRRSRRAPSCCSPGSGSRARRMSGPAHVPVLLDRVVALVAPPLRQPGSILVDATLGLGGHTEAVLAALPRGARRRRRPGSCTRSKPPVSGWLRSPGVPRSCTRCTTRSRGCWPTSGSRRCRGCCSTSGCPRCSSTCATAGSPTPRTRRWTCGWTTRAGITAAEVLNTYPAADLARILRTYGEEKFARPIARAIVREREKAPFDRSARLVELLREVIPAPARRTGGHPAKRTFQALRIEVNDELGVLRRAIPAAIDSLAVGGRVVVMSYQSLEDRMVKRDARVALAHVRRPTTCRSSPRSTSPSCDCSPEGPRRPRPTRSRRIRGPRRCGCEPPSVSGRRRHEHARRARRAPGHRASRRRRSSEPASPWSPPSSHARAEGALRRAGVRDPRRRGRRAADVQHPHAAGVVLRHPAPAPGRRAHRPPAVPRDGARAAARTSAAREGGQGTGHGRPGRTRVRPALRRQRRRRPHAGQPG